MSSAARRPEPITDAHDVSGFDCGNETLNTWLRSRALDNERRRATRTFVATRDLQAADIAGIRILLVHAVDEQAKAWYRQFELGAAPVEVRPGE